MTVKSTQLVDRGSKEGTYEVQQLILEANQVLGHQNSKVRIQHLDMAFFKWTKLQIGFCCGEKWNMNSVVI